MKRVLPESRAAAALAAVLLAGCSLVPTGCSSSRSSSHTTPSASDTRPGAARFQPPDLKPMASLGHGEGAVNLVVWAGYAEAGQDDPKVDWVHPFEQQTGCKVTAKVAADSDEMVSLMNTGQWDAVSASGDATLRLIASGTVAPVNTDLVPNYKDIFDQLKLQPWNSVNGVPYGIPHGRGANLLMYTKDKVTPAPNSWSAVFEPDASVKGKVTDYDSPIYIADAALFLMKSRPELGIKDPYSLDGKQFAAAVNLLKAQHSSVADYWGDYTKEVSDFESGDNLIGTTWQVIKNTIDSDKKVQTEAVLPTEGATGWSDTWMVDAKAAHPNCAYEWMNWIVSPEVNAQVAEYFGEAPSNAKACDHTQDKNFCAEYHASDAPYWNDVHYWTTPTEYCDDGRGKICTPYKDWVTAWNAIKS